ncbi:MAG: lactonase family protein [Lachnospiraceae bacterium]|nr:lactonase family protein [Lachnospiraceae bacterium]
MGHYYLASGYSHGQKDDLILFRVSGSGKMEIISACRQGDSPSFLCTMGKKIYAVSEQPAYAAVTAYILQKGKLAPVKRIEFAGAGLCHLYAGEKVLYASCYGSGHMYVLDDQLRDILYCHDGRKGFKGMASRMHWTVMPDRNTLLAADCGSSRVYVYSLRDGVPYGSVGEIPLKEGSGPRQILFDRKTESAVIVNEQEGTLLFAKSRFWEQKTGNFPGELAESIPTTQRRSSGNYPGGACINSRGELFVANRGENTIGMFRLGGRCSYLGEWDCSGIWPRYLHAAEENLLFAACERSGQVNSFLQRDGRLLLADSIPLSGAACVVPCRGG